MDGNFARAYNMTSDFGDIYDHISDITKYVILYLVIYFSKLNPNTKILFIVGTLVFYFLSATHLGCQEKIYDKSSSLDLLRCLCHNEQHITFTRYFGVGTFMLVTSIMIYNIKYINKLVSSS